MSHPRRFEDDDPYLARLRRICLALPEAAEKGPHELHEENARPETLKARRWEPPDLQQGYNGETRLRLPLKSTSWLSPHLLIRSPLL